LFFVLRSWFFVLCLPRLPNGIYFSVYSIGVKFFEEDKRSEFNRGPLIPVLKSGCGSSFSKKIFTGRVFGDMFFKLFAPERLKRSTGSVQCVQLCKISRFTEQVAPFNFVSCYAGVLRHT